MPDPVLYLQAMAAAAGASAIFVLALGRARAPGTRVNSASVLGVGLGLALGYRVMHLLPVWPPTNGLGRLLWIIYPAVIGIELLAGLASMPRWLAWGGRVLFAVTAGRILLHGSTYLTGPNSEWTALEASITLAICGTLLAAVWFLLIRLSEQSPGVSIPFVLSQSILCGGIAIMLAGYVSGGAAALPPAVALVAASVAARRITDRPAIHGIIGIGAVGLFSLLFIGRFFGGLSTTSAITILLAPLLGWATELPMFRGLHASWLLTLRFVLVAIPLAVVLAVAKRDFDREMAPLLGTSLVSTDPGCESWDRLPACLFRRQAGSLSHVIR